MIKKIFTAFIIIIILTFLTFLQLFNSENYNKNRGKDLYIQHCSKCHRKDGRGISNVYPPLKNADYIQNNSTIELLRGMLFGRSGDIIVNGVRYNGVMITEIESNVPDEDIALILTYIYNEFNSIPKIVSTKEVQEARKLGKLPQKK